MTTSAAKATIRSTARSTNSYITSTAALGLTTLMSTIGSTIVTIPGLVTQNATNMLTTASDLMITGDFNQTDISSNYEEKSLNTAEISAAITVPLIVVIGISCFMYRCYCRSNMRLPSDITNNVGFCQNLKNFGVRCWQSFRSCFARTEENDEENVYNRQSYDKALSNNTTTTEGTATNANDEEVNNLNNASSQENLLPQGQSNGCGTSNNAFASTDSIQHKNEAEQEGAVSLELSNTRASNGVERRSTIKISDSIV